MSTRFIRKETGTTKLLDRSTDAGVQYDTADGQIKFNDAGTVRKVVTTDQTQTLTNKVLTNPTVSGRTPATITGSSATLGPTHVGRITTLNRAAGIAATLPAATGSGDEYELVILATFTGAASVAVANAQDYMIGVAQMGIDGGTFVPHQYPTANTGTVATESDTISLFGTALSQGGVKGATVYLRDIAPNIWAVMYISDAGGTEANPFSAAV